jgi:hypothetical protein
MRKITLAAAAALAVVSTAAFASVTFDSNTGLGFAGKGDVQIALGGLNNAQIQAQARSLAFSFNSVDAYDAECYWETVTGKGSVIVHDITVPKHQSVSADVAYDARSRNQVTGFNLKGLGNVVTDGSVPQVGGACPGNNPGTVINVTQTGSTGGLYVSNGTTTGQLFY